MVKTSKGGKTNRKHGRNARKPSTKKYWFLRILEHHKVRNLMRHNGMTRAVAQAHWRKVRRTRIPWPTGGESV